MARTWGVGQVSDEGLCHVVVTSEQQRARAVWAVASLARDAEDCAQLLSALGLSAEERP